MGYPKNWGSGFQAFDNLMKGKRQQLLFCGSFIVLARSCGHSTR